MAISLLSLLLTAVPACNTASSQPLPRSMKGYELYSWQQDGDWHFTLITGTNRNKTTEEIVWGEREVGENGWVNLHVTGVAQIKDVLSRMPAGEFVFWGGGHFVTQSNADIVFELPPPDIINELIEHAGKQGLHFLAH